MPVGLGVETLQERNRLEIFATAMAVRDPSAFGPAVIEIEPRGDGVDPQAVDAVAIQPEQGVGDQEVSNFRSPVIENQRSPIEMLALAGIGMLVKRRAVEMRESMRIIRKMSRDPIEDHAQAGAMVGIE